MLSLLTFIADSAITCAIEALERGQVTAGAEPVRFASIEEAACPHKFCNGS